MSTVITADPKSRLTMGRAGVEPGQTFRAVAVPDGYHLIRLERPRPAASDRRRRTRNGIPLLPGTGRKVTAAEVTNFLNEP